MSKNLATSEQWRAVAQWWHSPEGLGFWRDENAALEPWLARCFGYHALHLGLQPLAESSHNAASASGALSGLRIPHVFQLGPLGGDVRARFDALPLEAESVDLVVVQHVLELAADPHAFLRELDRVLVPEGRVMLLSFNPLSYWGLRRVFNVRPKAPWLGLAPGRKRLRDWLGLLGYDLEDETWVGYGCMGQSDFILSGAIRRWLARLLPRSGAAHLLLARKRVSMPAPIRHRWRLMPGFSGVKTGNAVGAAPLGRKHQEPARRDGCTSD